MDVSELTIEEAATALDTPMPCGHAARYVVGETTLNCALCLLEAANGRVNELKIELLTLKQGMARKLLGGLAMVWTPEQIVKWAEERKDA